MSTTVPSRTSSEQRRSLKAARMLRHAAIMLNTEQTISAYCELMTALDLVNRARSEMQRGGRRHIRGRIARHWCQDCIRYENAKYRRESK